MHQAHPSSAIQGPGPSPVAGPAPQPVQTGDQPGSERVEMYVCQDIDEIGLVLHELTLEPPAKQRAVPLVSPVEILGVHHSEMLHGIRKVPEGRPHEKMPVFRHEGVGMAFDTEPFHRVSYGIEKVQGVIVVEENQIAVAPAIHDVVPGALKVFSYGASHGQRLGSKVSIVKA